MQNNQIDPFVNPSFGPDFWHELTSALERRDTDRFIQGIIELILAFHPEPDDNVQEYRDRLLREGKPDGLLGKSVPPVFESWHLKQADFLEFFSSTNYNRIWFDGKHRFLAYAQETIPSIQDRFDRRFGDDRVYL